MPKSMKKRLGNNHNKTKKICPISLKPFEEKFSKNSGQKKLKN